MNRIIGPWTHSQAEAFLDSCLFPLRLAVSSADGYPRIVSLWYRWQAGRFRCVTHQGARLLDWLRADPRCAFELAPNEPPYFGLRGLADSNVHPLGEEDLLGELIDRYLGSRDSALAKWLLGRRDEEVVIELTPRSMASWDYRERMAQP